MIRATKGFGLYAWLPVPKGYENTTLDRRNVMLEKNKKEIANFEYKDYNTVLRQIMNLLVISRLYHCIRKIR